MQSVSAVAGESPLPRFPLLDTWGLRMVVASVLFTAGGMAALALAPVGESGRFLLEFSIAAGMLATGAAAVHTLARRADFERPDRAQAMWALALASVVFSVAMAMQVVLGDELPGEIGQWAWAVPRFAVLPLLAFALGRLCFPTGLGAGHGRLVLVDAIMGGLALGIIGLLWLGPSLPRTESGQLATIDVLLLLGLWVVGVGMVAIASAARSRAVLPLRQFLLLYLAGLAYLIVDLGLVASAYGDGWTVAGGAAGHVVGMLLLTAFAARSPDEVETRRDARLREAVAAVVPSLPVLGATMLLLSDLDLRSAGGDRRAMAVVLLALLLVGAVVLRAAAARELRTARVVATSGKWDAASQEGWFQALVGETRDLIVVLDGGGHVVYCTPSMLRFLGTSLPVLKGRTLAVALSGGAPSEQGDDAWEHLLDSAAAHPGERVSLEAPLHGPAGQVREIEWSLVALVGLDIGGFVASGRDVTDDRRLRALLAETSSRDALTGLVNRDALVAFSPPAGSSRLAVLAIDIRDFGAVKDRIGHERGDQILVEVARALLLVPGPIGQVARTGGDSFVLTLHGNLPEIEVISANAVIRELLRELRLADGEEVPIEFAAGYAVGDVDEIGMPHLLSRAELALTQSRRMVPPPLVRYEPGMREAMRAARDVELDLRRALAESRLTVRYQPIVRLSDGAVLAVEALVRRERGDGSLEMPEVFIPVAERMGLVDRIDTFVLRRALHEVRAVNMRFGRSMAVSVNVSATELDDSLEGRLAEAVADVGAGAPRLIIEVTESAIAANARDAIEVLRRVRAKGHLIALDDFGTGYSSMASLAEMPVDILKIDSSFTQRLTTSGRGVSVMRAVVDVGRALGLATVAEGLATTEQTDLLRGMGCERGQGYLFAEPLDAAELASFLGGGLAVQDSLAIGAERE